MWLLTEQQHTQATLCVAVTAAGEGGDGSSEIEAREVPVPFFLMFAIPKCLTRIQIYNDVSVKHNETLLCLVKR
jgi:hypothetical protein